MIGTYDGERRLYDLAQLFYADETGNEYICFNGYNDPDGDDLSHESFVLPIKIAANASNEVFDFAFCKTERKPYDLLVGAILFCVGLIAPKDYKLNTDGEFNDFKNVMNFIQTVFKEDFFDFFEINPNVVNPFTPDALFFEK